MRLTDRSMVALTQLTDFVSAASSLEDVLDFIYEEFQSLIPYQRIGYAELDSSGEHLVARWARSDRPIRLNAGFSAPLSGSSLEHLLRSRTPRVLNDLRAHLKEHPRSVATQRIVDEGFRSSLTCPLVVEEQAVGVLFFTSDVPNRYSFEHTAMFEQIAGELALQILLTQERARSRKTLSATVVLLANILESTNPAACGQSTRARKIVQQLRSVLDVQNAWEVEMAALLCRLGCTSLPDELVDRKLRGDSLTTSEQAMLASSAEAAYQLLAKIPRFEGVAEIVRWQANPYDQSLGATDPRRHSASLLKAALDFDRCCQQGMKSVEALGEMRRDEAHYAPGILPAFQSLVAASDDDTDNGIVRQEVRLNELAVGMQLTEHVVTQTGKRLIGAGRVITDALISRLQKYAKTESVCEPIAVENPPQSTGLRSGDCFLDDGHASRGATVDAAG